MSRLIPPPKSLIKTAHTAEQISRWLQDFIPMCRLLRDLCLESNPSHSPSVQRILGFRCVTPTIFCLLPDSAIGRHAIHKKTPLMRSERHKAFVTKEILRGLLTSCLSEALVRRVMEAVSLLRSTITASNKDAKKRKSSTSFLDSTLLMAVILDCTRDFERPDVLQKRRRLVMSISFNSKEAGLTICSSIILNDIYSNFAYTAHNTDSETKLDFVNTLREILDTRFGIQIIRIWIHESVSSESNSRSKAEELMKLFIISYALRDQVSQTFNGVNDQEAPNRVNNTYSLDKIRVDFLHMCEGRKSWSPLPVLNLLGYYIVYLTLLYITDLPI
jgi:hypothetical protein